MTDATLIDVPAAQPAPPRHSPRAAAVLALLSLGLIASGGCFLIGVGFALDLIHLVPQNVPQAVRWTDAHYVYLTVLYLCAAGCISGGLGVAVLCIRTITIGR